MSNISIKDTIRLTDGLTIDNLSQATPEQLEALLKAPTLLKVCHDKIESVLNSLDEMSKKH